LKLIELYTIGVMSLSDLMLLVKDLKCKESECLDSDEIFLQLERILGTRERSRRVNNLLLKPVSEADVSTFKKEDRISSSYYLLSKDFPIPICTGRLENNITVMNDHYCSVTHGSENFKFKQKYEFEENLFRTEDAIYSYDH
jgi:histone deacetylase complex regulatory component SIN3